MRTPSRFGVILALDSKNGFSKNGKIPWKSPEDMQYFKMITEGHTVVMGRKTYQSIGRPLPNRDNVVLSSDLTFNPEGVKIVRSIEEIYEIESLKTIWIIGGIELIKKFMFAERISITTVNEDYECDQFFDYDFSTMLSEREKIKIKLNSNTEVSFYQRKSSHYNDNDKQYVDILKQILAQPLRKTRNGLVRSMFGATMRFNNISENFPILYSKRVFWKGIVEELLFFLSGNTNTKLLEERGVNIWKGNTSRDFIYGNSKTYPDPPYKYYDDGDMGPMYGYQWRRFNAKYGTSEEGIDQLQNVIDLLVNDPMSRRILMTTYNPSQAEEGVLYPCHGLTVQLYVDQESTPTSIGKISLSMYQRSADWFLGVPFNITSYAMMLCMIVQQVNSIVIKRGLQGYIVGDLVMNFGDIHLYNQHLPQALEQLQRSTNETHQGARFVMPSEFDLLSSELWTKYSSKDFYITDYNPLSTIKADMVA